MAANTDESTWKPRRTRGTPSYYYRNRFAAVVLVTGTALFAGLYTLVYNPSAEKKLQEFFTESEEHKDRGALIALLTRKRGTEILKVLEEQENFKREK